MICPKCGSPQQDGAVFCGACGVKLEAVAPPLGFQPAPVVTGTPVSWCYGSFSAKYVGIIVFGVLFLGMLATSVMSGVTMPRYLSNLLPQSMGLGVAAMGMIVVGRTGGIDLSIAGLIALSSTLLVGYASQGMLGVGVIVALVTCLVIGFLNGVFTVILRIPSVLVTLVTLLLVRYINYLILQGQTIALRAGSFPVILYVLFALAVIGAFLFIFFTKLGKPFPQRDGRRPTLLYLMAYLFSAAMACLAGIIFAFRLNVAAPTVANGLEFNILFLLLVAGSSTLWDNRVAPVIVTLVSWFLISMFTIAMSVLGLNLYIQGIDVALYLLLALALDRVYRRNIFPFKPLDSKV